jgi:hypothetical protein
MKSMIKIWNRQAIVELWNRGMSASRIIEELSLDVTVRQVQRIGAEYGNRKVRASGRLQADQDFIRLYRPLLEPLMASRGHDPYRCDLCGKVSDKKRTIHHTKYEGATLDDLVYACWSCQHQASNHGLA